MTAGLKRIYGFGHLHFITSSCYHRRPLLGDSSRRDLFLEILELARQRFDFVVVGYVVMPEHFHLLINEPPTGNPSLVMKWLKFKVARRILGELKTHTSRQGLSVPSSVSPRDVCGTPAPSPTTPDRFWQHRFYDFNVFTEPKWIEKLTYMHQNPVKRGLVSEPEQWNWSSARFYCAGTPGPVRINEGWPIEKKLVPR